MNKTPRLSKSNIEYLTHTWNFMSGCLNGCTYCWARPLTERFSSHYPNGFEPTTYPDALLSPLYLKKPGRIGVCFMGDLFGDWVDPNGLVQPFKGEGQFAVLLKEAVFSVIESCPQHTFLFLTKQPQNLPQWSPFPDNCEVGVTVCNQIMHNEAIVVLNHIKAKVKYISYEPLLSKIILDGAYDLSGIDQVIIGACTGNLSDMWKLCKQYPELTLMPWRNKWTAQPRIEWVREIVEAADKAGIAVFIKDNLAISLSHQDRLFYGIDEEIPEMLRIRQEVPHGTHISSYKD